MTYQVAILGTRGIPARHGGFETFAQELALDLSARGVDVSVYCQADAGEFGVQTWQGIRCIWLSGLLGGALGTVLFDLRCVVDVIRNRPSVVLTLGYNTAVFGILLRMFRIPNVINMDGVEWKRSKWGRVARMWFRLNEWIGALVGCRLVADHPEIERHLSRHDVQWKTVMIPYGAHPVKAARAELLDALGVDAGNYFCVIARPEPENSILEIVRAFSARDRGVKLLVLGSFNEANPYHREVRGAASGEVFFCGPIYDSDVVAAIRFYCIAYIHGHTVGGTNPSLVEALGAGAAVIAHDNPYNRWVVQDAGLYFDDSAALDSHLSRLLEDLRMVSDLKQHAVRRHAEVFTWPEVLGAYRRLLRSCVA